MKMHKVTIITPLHNKGEYIAETIQSVLGQEFPDWEMIIVENGSADRGPEIAAGFNDSRIRQVVSEKTGPGAARNHGLKIATGEWVLFLDADDLLTPDFLKTRIEHLDVNGNSSSPDIIVGGWEEFSSRSSERIPRRPSGEVGGKAAIEEGAIAAAPWALHAGLIRRDVLGVDPWPEELDRLPSEDTVFWFSLIWRSRIDFLPEYGALYRIPEHSTRNRPEDVSRWVKAINAVVEKNIAFLTSEKKSPAPAQIACIMRGFEAAYCRAIAASDETAAKQALDHAEQWLARCPFSAGAIMLRKILGIKLFCRIRSLVKKHPVV